MRRNGRCRQGKRRRSLKRNRHLFSHLFYCEACGTTMRQHHTQGKKYVYFICGKHHKIGNLAYSSHYINYNTLYQVVLEDIRRNAKMFQGDGDRAVRKLMELKCSDEQKGASSLN